MRVLALVLVGAFAGSAAMPPAMAQTNMADAGSFQSSYRSEATGSIEIGRIDVGPALRQKAELLGEAELGRLTGYLREVLQNTLVAADWHGVSAHETVLNVTLIDVVPSRPTLSQIQQMDTAHYTSEASGGAELSAELVDAHGRPIGQYAFRWYNTEPTGHDTGIWSDTRLAFSLFARELTDSLGEAPMPRRLSESR